MNDVSYVTADSINEQRWHQPPVQYAIDSDRLKHDLGGAAVTVREQKHTGKYVHKDF